MAPTPPLSETRLRQIATDACDAALSTQPSYVHSSTPSWNSAIINKILESLISETSSGKDSPPQFKFCVNSTIIQHAAPTAGVKSDNSSKDSGVGLGGTSGGGRRGMHSAAGAYWNNDKDGMWSFKYEGGERMGMDVVISVMWIAV